MLFLSHDYDSVCQNFDFLSNNYDWYDIKRKKHALVNHNVVKSFVIKSLNDKILNHNYDFLIYVIIVTF